MIPQGWLFGARTCKQHWDLQTYGETQQGERWFFPLSKTFECSRNQGKKPCCSHLTEMMKNEAVVFSFSATRSLEWRYWHTMGLFIMGTETSSGRRWVGCWAWRQRRSAAGRRQEKLWRNVKGKLPSTPWYDRVSSSDYHSVTWVLIPFSILPSLFRKEASPTRHFLQRMSSLNLVRYKIAPMRMFILII